MPQMRVIPTEQLEVDPDVQLVFALNPARVRKMGANWKPALMGFLVVVPDGNGGYTIVDGRHRFRAGILREVKEWRCDIHDEITYNDVEAKAALKLGYDRERRNVSSLEHFIIRVKAQDPVAVDIDRIVQDCGFVIGKTAGRGTERTIAAVAALERVYRAIGASGFRRTMQLNTHWLDEPMSTNAIWIVSLGLLVRDGYDDAMTPSQLEKLRAVVPAVAIRHSHGALVRKNLPTGMGGGNGAFHAFHYEVATYIRKKAGMHLRPIVKKSAKDSKSRSI